MKSLVSPNMSVADIVLLTEAYKKERDSYKTKIVQLYQNINALDEDLQHLEALITFKRLGGIPT